jgi:hypothetical protein
LFAAAGELDISKSSLKRAKYRLNVGSKRIFLGSAWHMPENEPAMQKPAHEPATNGIPGSAAALGCIPANEALR